MKAPLIETRSRDSGQEKGGFSLNSWRRVGSRARGGTSEVLGSLTTFVLCFQYFVFTGVLAMVTCAVFLRLNSVLKLAVLLIMIAIYALLTETIYAGLFLSYDNLNHSGE